MGRLFPLLEGYRALAAFMVLATHVAFNSGEVLSPLIGPILGRMDFGVTLFFLLSGFLLYRPWAQAAMLDQQGPRLKSYALRRTMRIFPAYLVMAAFTLAVLPDLRGISWTAWPIHFGLLHIYVPGYALQGLTQTWSLATEVAFYAALPIFAWIAGRRARGNPDKSARGQLGVLGSMVAVAWVFTLCRATGLLGEGDLTGYWLPGFLDWFALGMAAAVIQVRLAIPHGPAWMYAIRQLSQATGWCLLIALALAVVAFTPIAGPLTFFEAAGASSVFIKHLLYGAIALFLLLPGFLGIGDLSQPQSNPSTWFRFLTNPVVVYLGVISYGVFLWHIVLLNMIQRGLGFEVFSGGFWILLPLVVAASVGVASLSWFLLERPILIWAHRVSTKRHDQAGKTPASPPRPTAR